VCMSHALKRKKKKRQSYTMRPHHGGPKSGGHVTPYVPTAAVCPARDTGDALGPACPVCMCVCVYVCMCVCVYVCVYVLCV
jgi:hypothetical protein